MNTLLQESAHWLFCYRNLRSDCYAKGNRAMHTLLQESMQ